MPEKSPRHIPAAPVPGTVVLDPLSYEQDKTRIKRALALGSGPGDWLAPSQVGYYMDVLQGRLKQMAGKSLALDRQGDRIILDMSLGFGSGSTRIDPGSGRVLTPLARVLVEYRMTLVSLQIVADVADPAAARVLLAQQRAQAVAHYLAEAGVAGKRIVIVGSGLNRPPTADSGMENHARVELQIEPVVRSVSAER